MFSKKIKSIKHGKVVINGKTIKVPSNSNVSIINGILYVNEKEYMDGEIENKEIIDITIEGNVKDINCSGSVEVRGNVSGSIDCGGSATIEGSVKGDIDCGGNCHVQGDCKGDIDAGGNVNIR
ncbi:TPA: polymer-forming cytoskeletal protein [Clostridioides difficile]|uniref:Polymer-forming cytoskeletal protein n=1 Tax=Clostridioides difficile TaxID=1496 RepID=A0AAN5VR50_CLODI|nr:hypothetical protein BGU81_18820 [Clostridioides difficile]HBH1544632.1 polymer-forming cytoskeletal protein [Clostridioides difficile]